MKNENISKFIKNNKPKAKKWWLSILNSLLFSGTILLTVLIVINIKPELKEDIKEQLFNKTLSFTKINNWYKEKFGDVLPFEQILPEDETQVFNEELSYDNISLYKDGAALKVSTNYLVPVIESGIIVYVGEKENYGKTIIVQQANGIDVWYGNVNIGDYQMYDYVTKGNLLGEVSGNTMYLVFQQEGEYLDYKDYI